MSLPIVCKNDMVKFDAPFADAVTIATPTPIATSGWRPTILGIDMCTVDDTPSVVASATYTAGAFSIAGQGALKIKALKNDQQPSWLTIDGTSVLLKGITFEAEFRVTVAAKNNSTPAVDDPQASVPRMGTGAFIATETLVTVS